MLKASKVLISFAHLPHYTVHKNSIIQ